MGKCILFGEPMALLIADEVGPLEQVEHFTRAMSGAEVNVSIGLTRLGHSVEYLTRLGDDPFGHYIANALQDAGIGTSLISFDPVYRTGIQLKNRVTDGSDPYAPYYRKGSAASHISKKEIDEIDLDGVDLIHVTGIPPALSQTAREATFRLVERAKEKGIFLTFDPNLRPPLWKDIAEARAQVYWGLSQCDVLKIADNEIEFLTGTNNFDKGVEVLSSQCTGIRLINVTAGANGSYAYYQGKKVFVPSFLLGNTIETTGAGDTFCASVLNFVLERGLDGLDRDYLKQMLRFANAAAYLVTTRKGAIKSMPERKQVEEIMREH